jgi:hypothetical protein
MLTTSEAAAVLSVLCTKLGFCLAPEVEARLAEAPPPDVHHFTEAVFIAEGLDLSTADRKLYRQVKAIVANAFRESDERQHAARLGDDVPDPEAPSSRAGSKV